MSQPLCKPSLLARRPWRALFAGTLLALGSVGAWAQAEAPSPAQGPSPGVADAPPAAGARVEYAIGLAAVDRPAYAGSATMAWKLRPLWTVKWGRYRLSGARSSGLLGRPGDDGSGASAELAEGPHWRLGASLGVDGGRSSSDDPRLAGLPDQRATVRGKLYATRDLGAHWSLSGQLSQDLAGRGGGTLGALDLGYGRFLRPGLRLSASMGLGLADARAMRHQFGVDPEVAGRTGRVAYVPTGGLRDLHMGVTAQWAVSSVWFGFAGAGISRLAGGAADSPLVARSSSTSLALGLAWRRLP